MSSASGTADTLRKNALGAPHIVCFVVAVAAPLTAVVDVTPAAFMLGKKEAMTNSRIGSP